MVACLLHSKQFFGCIDTLECLAPRNLHALFNTGIRHLVSIPRECHVLLGREGRPGRIQCDVRHAQLQLHIGQEFLGVFAFFKMDSLAEVVEGRAYGLKLSDRGSVKIVFVVLIVDVRVDVLLLVPLGVA